jgi:hypothetical protein
MKELLTEKILEIPQGRYCYTPKSYDNGEFKIKLCPFYTSIKDEGVRIPYCNLLNEGCVPNGTSEEDFYKLSKKYGSDAAVWDKYPLDLLWDQVKECGENIDYDE